MKNICIFCGSSFGSDPAFEEAARSLGRTLAERNITLVYGGSNVGLMGATADAALEAGGEVVGVLPEFLRNKEVAHNGLTELYVVESMHERKTKMHELSDGIIALPGGFGTLEEYFEMLTWGQLGLHAKPVGLLNIDGFFDPLIAFLDRTVEKGFVRQVNRDMALISSEIGELLDMMTQYRAPDDLDKWIRKGTAPGHP